MSIEPKLYVGTYKKYNEGNLGGAWLNLFDYADKDEFIEACKELHADESDPELMFQDAEYVPNYSESSVDEALWELTDLADDEYEAFIDFANNLGSTELPNVDDFRDAYYGQWDSMRAFAENLAEELGYYKILEDAGLSAHYFDDEAFARDLEVGGDYWISKNGYVFRNC